MNHDDNREARTYRLCLPFVMRLLCFAGLLFPLLFAVPFFLGAFEGTSGEAPPRVLGLVPFAIGVWYGYWVFSTPHKILFHKTGEIDIVSVLRHWRFKVQEIRSISPSGSMMGFLVVRTTNGSVRVLNQFDGFHDFITNIKVANPSVELHGC
jgi:hypothetical protein